MASQTEAGLLPHITYWQPRLVHRWEAPYLEASGVDWLIPGRKPRASAQMQPPLVAQALEAVVDRDEDDRFLHELLPSVGRFYGYLAATRDPDRDGLVAIFSQFESGLDFSPLYDSAPGESDPSPQRLRSRARAAQVLNKLCNHDPRLVFRVNPARWKDVLVNTLYIDGLTSLARLAGRAGTVKLERWADARARATLGVLLERCYDERRGLFFTLAGRKGRKVSVRTIVSLLPLLLENLPREVADRLVEHLADPKEFWSCYPVPSVALDEPSFIPVAEHRGHRCIWRGPCSLNTNWLLCRGLRRHGYDDLADELARRSRVLVEEGGFNEFYNPLTGEPVGVNEFGWATLASII